MLKQLNLNQDKVLKFLKRIQGEYKQEVQYHNATHAADLACTAFFYCKTGGFKEKANLDHLEFFSILIGGACHDLGHFGVNNAFLMNNRKQLAIRYNDQAILENYHVASTFEILQESSDINFATGLGDENFKKFRHLMIKLILATDMAEHFSKLTKAKNRITSDDFSPTDLS